MRANVKPRRSKEHILVVALSFMVWPLILVDLNHHTWSKDMQFSFKSSTNWAIKINIKVTIMVNINIYLPTNQRLMTDALYQSNTRKALVFYLLHVVFRSKICNFLGLWMKFFLSLTTLLLSSVEENYLPKQKHIFITNKDVN